MIPVNVISFLFVLSLCSSRFYTYGFGIDNWLEEDATSLKGVIEENLLQQMNIEFGWDHGETPRAVVTLGLSNSSFFSKDSLISILVTKQLKLELSAILLRWHKHSITAGQMAMFINALITICENPYNFFGINLISRLRHMPIISDYERALISLSLCNAGAKVSRKEIDILNNFLISGNVTHKIDTQSMALIALNCLKEHYQSTYIRVILNESLEILTSKQKYDGSFGNIFTTGIVLQALLSAGEYGQSWQFQSAMEYLKKEYENPNVLSSILSHYFILPVLHLRTISDLWKISNCEQGRSLTLEHENDVWAVAMEEELNARNLSIVTYTLWFPDKNNENEILKVSTAVSIEQGLSLLDVMKRAAVSDELYRFSSKRHSLGVIIDTLAGLKNDNENKSFWFVYQFLTEGAQPVILDKDVSSIKPNDCDHFLLWYRKV